MAADARFHVLAVDDSLIDRKLIERLLTTSFNCQVTTVESGGKALEFLGWSDQAESGTSVSVSPKNHQVNLVITDYCMPEMTGFDLLKRIKESPHLRNIRVVIMSSENVPSRIDRCMEEGAEEFILKPVRLSDLNKLKPHLMRKTTEVAMAEKPENVGKQRQIEESSEPESGIMSQKQETGGEWIKVKNKRKWRDIERISPDMTRTRKSYRGFTVTVFLSLLLSLCFLVFG